MSRREKPIYLDFQSTTPCDARVVDAMIPYLTEDYGNPHSVDHQFGWRSAAALDRSRKTISEAINCEPSEIIFTSGATEANNLALKGLMAGLQPGAVRLLVSAIDHKSVVETAEKLRNQGYDVAFIPVNQFGIIELDFLEKAARKGPALVSVGYVNSEIGVIQPMRQIVTLCRRHGAILHTDATQAVGRIPIDFFNDDFDLLSLSAHKIFGPKGIGALIAKREIRTMLGSLIDGGGQQEGNRSGTIPTFLAIGLAAALEIALKENIPKQAAIADMASKLRGAIIAADPNCAFNAGDDVKIAGNINVTLSQMDAQSLLSRTSQDIAISTSSACSSGSVQPSHVLRAIGLGDEEIRRTIRLCVGETSSVRDIEFAATALRETLGASALAS